MALTLDPSKRNDIIIRQGQSLNFSFLLTNESDGEDFAVAGYTFNLEIYDRRRTKIFDLTDGEGLTVQDGSVAVSISANDLNIPDGDYKYFLVVTNPDAETNTWINGYAKVKDSLSIGSQDDVSVTVSNADNNVNITIGISGSSLSPGDQTKIDNLPENTTQELAGKADKATGHTTGNLSELDEFGNAVDAGVKKQDLIATHLGEFIPLQITIDKDGRFDDYVVTGNVEFGLTGTHKIGKVKWVNLTGFTGAETLTIPQGARIHGGSFISGDTIEAGDYTLFIWFDGVTACFNLVDYTTRPEIVEFDIASIGSTKVKAWYKDAKNAANIVQTTDVGRVQQWTDFSGNNRHAVQSTLANKPYVTPSGIEFNEGDANNHALVYSLPLKPNIKTDILFVYVKKLHDANDRILASGDVLVQPYNNGTIQVYNTTSLQKAITPINSDRQGFLSLLRVSFTPGSPNIATISVNETFTGSNAFNTDGTGTATVIGNRPELTAGAEMTAVEYVHLENATPEELQSVISELNRRYSIF